MCESIKCWGFFCHASFLRTVSERAEWWKTSHLELNDGVEDWFKHRELAELTVMVQKLPVTQLKNKSLLLNFFSLFQSLIVRGENQPSAPGASLHLLHLKSVVILLWHRKLPRDVLSLILDKTDTYFMCQKHTKKWWSHKKRKKKTWFIVILFI